MAKSARSKTRKHWASERRRTLGVPAEMKQLQEQANRLQASLTKQTSQPTIMRLKSVFKRPQAQAMAVQRRMAINNRSATTATKKQEKAQKKESLSESGEAAAMEAEAPVAEEEESEEEAEGMEVVPGKRATGKARTVSRFKKSGQAYSAKKQKRVKS